MYLVVFLKEGTELDFSKTTESLLNRGKSADIILASPIQNLLETYRKGKKPLDGRKWLLLFFLTLVDFGFKKCTKTLRKKFRNKIALAWFIWNAEMSVSVAIHCYERIF